MRKVFLSAQDISQYVSVIPGIPSTAGDFGQVVINNIQELTGVNTRFFWDAENPASPFFGAEPDTFVLTIEQDGIEVFNGSINTIVTDNNSKTAQVNLQSDLQRALSKGIIHDSAEQATPSEEVALIATDYGIAIDSGSFGAATAFYTANNVYISNAFHEPHFSVLEAIQQIAEIALGRVYSIGNILYYDAYDPDAAPLSIYEFTDSHSEPVTLWSHPSVETIEKEKINGYHVDWIGKPPVDSGDPTAQGKSISAGYDAAVRIMNFAAAAFLGSLWITYLNRLQKRVSFDTDIRIGRQLSLGNPVSYSYKNRAAVTVDLIGIDNSSNLLSKLVGLTR